MLNILNGIANQMPAKNPISPHKNRIKYMKSLSEARRSKGINTLVGSMKHLVHPIKFYLYRNVSLVKIRESNISFPSKYPIFYSLGSYAHIFVCYADDERIKHKSNVLRSELLGKLHLRCKCVESLENGVRLLHM